MSFCLPLLTYIILLEVDSGLHNEIELVVWKVKSIDLYMSDNWTTLHNEDKKIQIINTLNLLFVGKYLSFLRRSLCQSLIKWKSYCDKVKLLVLYASLCSQVHAVSSHGWSVAPFCLCLWFLTYVLLYILSIFAFFGRLDIVVNSCKMNLIVNCTKVLDMHDM